MSDEPSDAEIEALATELLHEDAAHDVAAAVTIGTRALSVLFNGDLEAFSSQDPFKPNSISRLAVACRRSRPWITNRVRVASVYPYYDAPFRDQVSLSVHVALLRAPEIERNQLLRQAAMQGLSAQAVDHLIDQLLDPSSKPPPSDRPTGIERVLQNEEKLLAEAQRATDPERRAALLDQARQGKAMFARLERVLIKPPEQSRKKKQ